MRIDECWVRRGLLLASLLVLAGCATAPRSESTAPRSDSTARGEDKAAAHNAKPTVASSAASGSSASAAQVPPKRTLPAAALSRYEQARRSIAADRLDEAERELVALTQAHPEFAAAQASLGALYRRAGKLGAAVTRLEQAAQGDAPTAWQLNELGIAYREAGKFAKAREAYESAIGLDQNYAPAQLNLGILLDIYLWDGAAALAAYERYLLLAGADEKVGKWVAELRNRQPKQAVARGKEPQ